MRDQSRWKYCSPVRLVMIVPPHTAHVPFTWYRLPHLASASTVAALATASTDAKVLLRWGDAVMSTPVGRVNARIDDDVHVAARQAALGLGLKFEQYVEQALREKLERDGRIPPGESAGADSDR